MSDDSLSFRAELLRLAVIQKRFLCLEPKKKRIEFPEEDRISTVRTEERNTHPLLPQLLFRFGRPHFQSLVFFLLGRLHRLAQYRSTDAQFRHVLFVEGVVRLKVIDLRGECSA